MAPLAWLLLVTPASSTCGCVGWTAMRLTNRQSGFASTLVAGRKRHVLPPSVDLNAPTPTRPPLASPVPSQALEGFSGSKAIVVTERLGRKSLFARQEAP